MTAVCHSLQFLAFTTYMLYISVMGMTAKQVMKILKKNGWKLVRTTGSHHIFYKPGEKRPIPVPRHDSIDLGNFAKSILKEAGIILQEDKT